MWEFILSEAQIWWDEELRRKGIYTARNRRRLQQEIHDRKLVRIFGD
jgi:hypothetical protein